MKVKIGDITYLCNETKDLIKNAKKETLSSSNISSFKMNEYNIINNGNLINIYTLIPGLENSIIIEFNNSKQESKIYMIKDHYYSEISVGALKELKIRDSKLEYLEDSINYENILEIMENIPSEFAIIQELINKITSSNERSEVINEYNDFCNAVSLMRKSQMKFISSQIANKGISRTII